MKKKFSVEQIVSVLKQAEVGVLVADGHVASGRSPRVRSSPCAKHHGVHPAIPQISHVAYRGPPSTSCFGRHGTLWRFTAATQ